MSGALAGFELSRRKLLKALGGGILVAVVVPDAFTVVLQESGRRGRGGQIPQVISAWVHIGADGKITIFSGKAEVGQNVRTSLTQAAAEELRVPPQSISVLLGDTDLVPYDMGTFGSRSTPTMVPQVRKAAAGAREALLDLAAQRWQVDRKDLRAEAGQVFGPGPARIASYGELAKGQPIDKAIDPAVALTAVADWKVLGKPVPKVDAKDFVTGKHDYAIDQKRPNILHAKVLRAPSFGAKLTSVDTSAAAAMAGVKVVHDGDFVAVAAPTVRLAEKALGAVDAKWSETEHPSSKELFRLIRGTGAAAHPDTTPGIKSLQATYTCPYIAHVPLEPRAALAEWDGKKMTVWTGSQRPFGVRDDIAGALGLEQKQVRVIVPDTGSGYGGKHTGDAAVEAARAAKALGRPVKVAWTRHEEFTHAYFRPAGVVEVSSAIKPDGLLASWQFDNYNSGGSGIGMPYDVPSPKTEFHEADSPLRQGSYRGLAATFNNFSRESHIDELAHSAGLDPLEFRLKNLKNERLAAVLRAAAEKFGWGKAKAPTGHGHGIACGTEKGSYLATAAEVSVDPETKQIKVVRAVTAFECGAILNPDLLNNQVVGALIMGLGGALFEGIDFAGGKILTDRLSRYRVPRYSDIPHIECVLVDRPDLPSAGAGETPIMCIGPAIGNAVFAATGVRLRSLPLRLPA